MPKEVFPESCRVFFDGAPTAMWLQQGREVVYANTLALSLFGCTAPECLAGKDILSFLVFGGGESGDEYQEALALLKAVEDGEAASVEWQCRRLDGVTVDLHVDLGRHVIDGEAFIHLAARDVTGVLEAMQGYRTAIRQTEEFIATFSHELRTALFSILGFSNILRQDSTVIDTEQMKEFLSILNVETLKISSLVEDVLSLSRIKGSASLDKRRLVDIGGLLEELVGGLADAAARKRVVLRLNLKDDGLNAFVAPDAVKRALINIVDNALMHTPAEGSVELRAFVDRLNSVVSVEVRDSGIGISAADLPHIFDRFYRVQRTGIQNDGYGLGLSISREIIGKNNGSIAVESEIGKGSVFRVDLPLSKTASGAGLE
ncbi:HAMP domain-containing sensor histidine kinase [Chlorobium sp. N1]|uniref:PAS domain-containing sensor histidine kinase n=1 Tax=Chlorobium sp. N1 TaxID=2491138 RepID=UPI0013F168A7|nr:HAMP domain-containing sensor histidine kinase [Chlorobium sp. N1]